MANITQNGLAALMVGALLLAVGIQGKRWLKKNRTRLLDGQQELLRRQRRHYRRGPFAAMLRAINEYQFQPVVWQRNTQNSLTASVIFGIVLMLLGLLQLLVLSRR